LAQIGIASRRACDAIIADGRVKVDGRVVRELGTKVVVGVNAVKSTVRRWETAQRIVPIMHKPKES
jgi:16S rRNA U516 pseudouridylate synthase RsuA-like enzyme